MKFATAVTREPDTGRAAATLVAEVERQLDGCSPDLVLFYGTRSQMRAAGVVVSVLGEAWRDAVLLGTTAAGILYPGTAPPRRPTLGVQAAVLPEVALLPFQMQLEDFEQSPVGLERWQELLEAVSDPALLLVLADPYTTPANELIETLNMIAPGIPVTGALASGARQPGGHMLALNDTLHRAGLIGVALTGNVRADVLVSQGYRPVGKPFKVTRAEGNVLLELSGQPAMEALEQMVSGLPREEQLLLRSGLMLGEAVSDFDEELGRGDFLIRPVVRLDHEEGAISLAGLVDKGRTIRFQVWDNSLAQDLQMLLLPQIAETPAAGGLIFGSWPRRRHVRGMESWTGEIQNALGYPLPLTGFRSSGEIGPLHGVNYVHTHTAALTLVRPAKTSPRTANIR